MTLFLIGVVEMLIVTVWTKFVADSKILASGFITMINVMIWYYVLQALTEDISNWHLALLYAAGCSIGTVICTYYFHKKEKKEATA